VDTFEPPSDLPADVAGSWSVTYQLPIIAVAAAMTATGGILVWSSNTQLSYETDIGTAPSNTLMALITPSTGAVSPALDSGVQADMFCPGIAILPDGRVLVDGGSSSSHTSLYDPFNCPNGTFTDNAPMNIPRGYNSAVTLSGGSVFTIGGSWAGDANQTKDGELWTAAGGWQLTGISGGLVYGPDVVDQAQGFAQFGDDYQWLFAMPGGRVFDAGPANQMWFFDPAAGTAVSAGTRGNDPYSTNGICVMYDVGKIFKAGGAPGYTEDDTNPPTGTINATNSAYIIDISQDYVDPTAMPAITQVAPLNHSRAYANGVVLPDGEVFIVGGQSEPYAFRDTNSMMTPELWNPLTQQSTDLAPMPTPRNYHSTALLMPDGRVFVGGGGQCGGCTDPNGLADDHLDYEFYSPPYLFNADGSSATQPTIISAPANFTLGDQLTVTASSDVAAFSLVRIGSATHTLDTDQRRVPLTIASSADGHIHLNVPSDPGITVPGYWMLFALNANDTPSVAAIIQIGSPAGTMSAIANTTMTPQELPMNSGTTSAAVSSGSIFDNRPVASSADIPDQNMILATSRGLHG
jgi:hypothetical protein